MAWFSSILVGPIYRLLYGRPLDDALPFEGDGNDGETSSTRKNCRGMVLVADGVGGLDLCGTALRYVLSAEGLPYAIHLVPWGHGFGRWFADLTDVANRDAQAVQVADSVRRFHDRQPDDPVFLIAKSGGSGVMVKALERLADSPVETAVFLSPALSPDYDLTAALQGVRQKLVVFWSPWDAVVLGVGTRVFGTADRTRTVSAGMVGFRRPADRETCQEQRRQYAKLVQIRWTPRMAVTGYLGGHVGPDSPLFLKRHVVPLLRAAPPDDC